MTKAGGEGISGMVCSRGMTVAQFKWKASRNTRVPPKTQVSLGSALREEHGYWFSKLTLPGAHVLGVPLGTL